MKLKKPLIALLALSVTLMACSQDNTPATVVDVAVSDENFSTLVAAVQEAGLVETLSSEGPFTVFAPTNAAFEQALADLGITADELLASPDLGSILTYHVVPGRLLAADVVAAVTAGGGEYRAETVNGAEIVVTLDGGMVMLNGVATVTKADLLAGNGVVHVIDAVLLPPSN